MVAPNDKLNAKTRIEGTILKKNSGITVTANYLRNNGKVIKNAIPLFKRTYSNRK